MDPSVSADQAENTENSPMLNNLEARILGALMEKQLTTPDAYPLTLNSLVLACNQKTSREPTMNLEEGEVKRCLYQLQERQLVEFEYGSRADKFDQRLSRTLLFNEAEHAVFCIMLLRGPQTVSELLSRTRRMYEFKNSQEVLELLIKLLAKFTPLAIKIPQQVGQREERYMHLLCGEPDLSMTSETRPSESVNTASTPSLSSTNELTDRVDELEKQVAWLIEQLGGES